MVKIKFIQTVLLSFTVSLITLSVQAAAKPIAKITDVTGRVLVNQGEEYIVAEPGMPLNIDDRVITMDSSEVTIFYPDLDSRSKAAEKGCEVRLPENSQMLVESEEDCIMGPIISEAASDLDEGAVIGETPAVVNPAPAIVAAGPGFGLLPALIFAMPVVCAATDCLGDDDDQTSPE